MAIDGSIPTGTSDATALTHGVVVPASKPLSHLSNTMVEKIDNFLRGKGVLIAAQGGMQPRCNIIKDSHAYSASPTYGRELSARMEHDRRNRENQAKRHHIILEERSTVSGLMVAMCEEALELKRDIINLCSNNLGEADHQDGPRAYRMVLDHLHGSGATAGRTKPDKAFYGTAFLLQEQTDEAARRLHDRGVLDYSVRVHRAHPPLPPLS